MFEPFRKIPRLYSEMVITEDIDGAQVQIAILPIEPPGMFRTPELPYLAHGPLEVAGETKGFIMLAGSRTRWVTPEQDNYGFARWVTENQMALWALGPGRHFGEWWGKGINRNYGLQDRRFSLFNVSRWHAAGTTPYVTTPGDPRLPQSYSTEAPAGVGVVPVLYRGPFNTNEIAYQLELLRDTGSVAAPGFANPEGVVVFHEAAGQLFKVTTAGDGQPKGRV